MTIGFVGAGNMATALMRGMIGGGESPASLFAYDINEERVHALSEQGVMTTGSIEALVEASDCLVLAVKPKDCRQALASVRRVKEKALLVSIAVGWTQEMLQDVLPNAQGIARCMPNTPALVGEGVLAFNANHSMEQQVFDEMVRALGRCGRTIVVPESLFDAVVGISGSGPAYAYLVIEALADAGVRQGLPRDMSYQLSAQMLLGAAKMVLETGKHPGALKDEVASPGGTTIEAIYALEKAGLRGAVMDAVDACARKAAAMAQK